jgi:hypothetical protein
MTSEALTRWAIREPQIAVDVIRTTASFGSSIRGAGTSWAAISRSACRVTAFTGTAFPGARARLFRVGGSIRYGGNLLMCHVGH